MPIRTVVLDDTERADQGHHEFDFDVQNPFQNKLSDTTFKDTWWTLIDAEPFDVECTLLNNKTVKLASGRITQQLRAFFVPYTTQGGEEIVIVIGYMLDHKHENYFLLEKSDKAQASRRVMACRINKKIHEIETTELLAEAQAKAAAVVSPEKSHSPVRRHPFNQCVLSATQQDALNIAAYSGLVLAGPGGSGKTLLLVRRIEQLISGGETILYLSPSQSLCENVRHAIAESVTDESLCQIITWEMLDRNIVYRINNVAILDTENRTPADFHFFQNFFSNAFCQKGVHNPYAKLDQYTVYQQITDVIIQPIVLSRKDYLAEINGPIEKHTRELIYHIFEQYRNALQHSKTHYEPHLRMFDVFRVLRSLDPEILNNLRVDYLFVDELQRAHPLFLLVAFFMLKDYRISCHYIFAGDVFQDAIRKEKTHRMTEIVKNMMHFFGVTKQPEIKMLEQSFRSGKRIAQLANRFLNLYHLLCGSDLRTDTFGVVTGAIWDGHLACMPHDEHFIRAHQQDADMVILVPNHMRIEDAHCHWPGMSVFHIKDFVGLEKKRVVMFGFSDLYRAELDHLTTAMLQSKKDRLDFNLDVTPRFVRREQHNLVSAELIMSLYSLVTRSIENVYVIDMGGVHPFFYSISHDIQLADISIVDQSMNISTPAQWLQTAKELLQGETPEMKQRGLEILISERIWGSTENTALAARWINKNSALDHVAYWQSVIAEVENIITSGDVHQALFQLVNMGATPESNSVSSDSSPTSNGSATPVRAQSKVPTSSPSLKQSSPKQKRTKTIVIDPAVKRLHQIEAILQKVALIDIGLPTGMGHCLSLTTAQITTALQILPEQIVVLHALGCCNINMLYKYSVLLYSICCENLVSQTVRVTRDNALCEYQKIYAMLKQLSHHSSDTPVTHITDGDKHLELVFHKNDTRVLMHYFFPISVNFASILVYTEKYASAEALYLELSHQLEAYPDKQSSLLITWALFYKERQQYQRANLKYIEATNFAITKRYNNDIVRYFKANSDLYIEIAANRAQCLEQLLEERAQVQTIKFCENFFTFLKKNNYSCSNTRAAKHIHTVLIFWFACICNTPLNNKSKRDCFLKLITIREQYLTGTNESPVFNRITLCALLKLVEICCAMATAREDVDCNLDFAEKALKGLIPSARSLSDDIVDPLFDYCALCIRKLDCCALRIEQKVTEVLNMLPVFSTFSDHAPIIQKYIGMAMALEESDKKMFSEAIQIYTSILKHLKCASEEQTSLINTRLMLLRTKISTQACCTSSPHFFGNPVVDPPIFAALQPPNELSM